MTRDEALDLTRLPDSPYAVGDKRRQAKAFLEGYEQGVRDSSEKACCVRYPEKPCEKILSLLKPSEGKKA